MMLKMMLLLSIQSTYAIIAKGNLTWSRRIVRGKSEIAPFELHSNNCRLCMKHTRLSEHQFLVKYKNNVSKEETPQPPWRNWQLGKFTPNY